jgi:hypothetical protein
MSYIFQEAKKENIIFIDNYLTLIEPINEFIRDN